MVAKKKALSTLVDAASATPPAKRAKAEKVANASLPTPPKRPLGASRLHDNMVIDAVLRAKANAAGAIYKGIRRPRGAFLQWFKDNTVMILEDIMKRHPGTTTSQVFRSQYTEGGTMWDKLPEKQRQDYESKAAAAKTKFQEEMEAWKAGRGASSAAAASAEAGDVEDEEAVEDLFPLIWLRTRKQSRTTFRR